MFNKIENPENNNEQISIFSEKGKNILKTYVKKINQQNKKKGGWGFISFQDEDKKKSKKQSGGWGDEDTY